MYKDLIWHIFNDDHADTIFENSQSRQMLQFCNSLYLVLSKITECAEYTHADILCLVMIQKVQNMTENTYAGRVGYLYIYFLQHRHYIYNVMFQSEWRLWNRWMCRVCIPRISIWCRACAVYTMIQYINSKKLNTFLLNH